MLPYGCTTTTFSSTSLRGLMNSAFVFFLLVMSFLVLALQWNGTLNFSTIINVAQGSQDVDGVVLSMKPERFNHTQHVLAQIGLRVVQRVPLSFQSKEVNESLCSFVGSPRDNSMNLKVWSNQMAFVNAMEEFVREANTATPKRWRFFFEDDVALNPNITSEQAKVLLAKGLEVADEDGFVYLGLCGPHCEESRLLDEHVEAARCYGACAHAFGLQANAAAKFLQHLENTKKEREIYMDQRLLNYGKKVKRVWVLGTNLQSPSDHAHVGLLYQDRIRFPTTIG
ncbi:hypothetical protein KC19_8G074400 [Ceratodon purpureus]|uniref:Uncharacterized protein n=1 Tax=Ceratodon purpureus TaxID=3225 RepID=A0A8T0GZX2_CERPU|nr:hypothetical protein KC19_8G074400 [Ceratodon purpureus]